jgi:N utilization substance protein B
MTRRSRGREVALQVLYQIEQNIGMPVTEVHHFINRRLLGEPKLVEFTKGLIAGVREHQPRIDELIKEVAENWRLDRMAAIDRNILRLGAYEVLFCPEVPAKVAINEALELAKRYSTAQSSRFVNGILDRVLQLHATPSQESPVAQPSALTSPSAPAGDETDSPPVSDPTEPAQPDPATEPETER